MPGKRHTTEQKIRILREAERAGTTIVEVCRAHQISEQTFHRWKSEFGMLEVDQAKQLKELKKENERGRVTQSGPVPVLVWRGE